MVVMDRPHSSTCFRFWVWSFDRLIGGQIIHFDLPFLDSRFNICLNLHLLLLYSFCLPNHCLHFSLCTNFRRTWRMLRNGISRNCWGWDSPYTAVSTPSLTAWWTSKGSSAPLQHQGGPLPPQLVFMSAKQLWEFQVGPRPLQPWAGRSRWWRGRWMNRLDLNSTGQNIK